MGELSAGI